MYIVYFSTLFRAFGNYMMFSMIWICIVLCSRWICVLAYVNSGGDLIILPKRVSLT